MNKENLLTENRMNKSCNLCLRFKDNNYDNCSGCFPHGSEDYGTAYCFKKLSNIKQENINFIKDEKIKILLHRIEKAKNDLRNYIENDKNNNTYKKCMNSRQRWVK